MNAETLASQAKRLIKKDFVEAYPNLFLIFGEGRDETPPPSFYTEAPPYPPAKWEFSGALQMAPLVKAPNSPYPERISVGRARNCDVVLRHPSVSKLHAHVSLEDGRWMLRDNGSHNGTTVGTMPLLPDKPVHLQSGDLVTFGAFTARVVDAAELYQVLNRMVQATGKR
jgi:hypothetical protein